ncbi:MAG: DUF2950 domain-containing protein [Terracidiphilus sp.]
MEEVSVADLRRGGIKSSSYEIGGVEMINFLGHRANSTSRTLFLCTGVAILLSITACQKQQVSTVQAGPATFTSPEDAGRTLANAAKSQDLSELTRIFGANSANVLSSGDSTEDKASLVGFSQAYQVMNRWRKLDDHSELLLIGADNQAFPIPLMKNASGQWYFDVAAGKDEILSRRIGRNEIATIVTSAAIVDAQDEYFSQNHGGVKQYAQKFISDPGQQNGLYWNSAQEGAARSPLGPLVAYATAEGYKARPDQHQAFSGYYFAMLDKQGADAKGGAKSYIVNGKMTGGFAIVAYPSQYGDSGIMTFILDQNGATYQKDLGKGTSEIASTMAEFNPDKTWVAVQ